MVVVEVKVDLEEMMFGVLGTSRAKARIKRKAFIAALEALRHPKASGRLNAVVLGALCHPKAAGQSIRASLQRRKKARRPSSFSIARGSDPVQTNRVQLNRRASADRVEDCGRVEEVCELEERKQWELVAAGFRVTVNFPATGW